MVVTKQYITNWLQGHYDMLVLYSHNQQNSTNPWTDGIGGVLFIINDHIQG